MLHNTENSSPYIFQFGCHCPSPVFPRHARLEDTGSCITGSCLRSVAVAVASVTSHCLQGWLPWETCTSWHRCSRNQVTVDVDIFLSSSAPGQIRKTASLIKNKDPPSNSASGVVRVTTTALNQRPIPALHQSHGFPGGYDGVCSHLAEGSSYASYPRYLVLQSPIREPALSPIMSNHA